MAGWWDSVSAALTGKKAAAVPPPKAPPPPPPPSVEWHPDLLPTSKVMSSSGSKALFTNDGVNYIDINDLQYPKPLPYKQHTQVVNLLLQDGVLKYDPTTQSYWHGDLLVGQGNTGPWAPHTHGLVSLVADAAKDLNLDSLATPYNMPSSWDLNSPKKPFWLKPLDKNGKPISDDGKFYLQDLDGPSSGLSILAGGESDVLPHVSYPVKGQIPHVPGVKWKQVKTPEGVVWQPDKPSLVEEAIASKKTAPPPGMESYDYDPFGIHEAIDFGSGSAPPDTAPAVFAPGPDDFAKSATAAAAASSRKPGEGIREYLARLRELKEAPTPSAWWQSDDNKTAVADAVRDLERQMAANVQAGLIGPAGEGPDIAGRIGKWQEWDAERSPKQFDKWDEAKAALIDKGILRRDDEAILGPDGKVFEDAEGMYRSDELQRLAAEHLGDDFFEGSAADVRQRATNDYLEYLSANGVDQRTIDDIASGALPMDHASRMARATQMGLDPTWTVYRQDFPLKTQFRGFTAAALSQPQKQRYDRGIKQQIDLTPRKEGLVYTAMSPRSAETGVQMPRGQVVPYPLWAPNRGIAGIDEIPLATQESFTTTAMTARAQKGKGGGLPTSLPPPIGGVQATPKITRLRAIDKATTRPYDVPKGYDRTDRVPDFSEAENRKLYTEPLMGAGGPGGRILGTLVTDETPLSLALTPAGARQLRRADLAALDPRFRVYRNLLQGLVPPVAVGSGALAVGAAGSQPRREMR